MEKKIEQIIDRNTEGNYLLSSADKAQMVSEIMDLVGVADSLPIEFLEWTEKGMWTKWENRNDGYHEMTGWYNTHNFAAMEQPLSSQELFELFMLERSKR